jgi:hypothetical protein
MNAAEEVFALIKEEFHLECESTITKEKLLKELEIRISKLLQQSSDSFFQLLYRLDIEEGKMRKALDDPANAVTNLALLIYERQIEKLYSRKRFSSKDSPEDPELAW